MKVRGSILMVVMLALALGSCATAPPPPPPPALPAAPSLPLPLDEPVPLDPDVRHGVLDNGLTFYVRENRRPEQRAELRLVVDAGSVLETDHQRGLAHFVEHMAFNGTRNFEKQELVSYLERIGMRFGPDVNAYTSFDETVYMLQVPTDDPEIVETAFRILHDWAAAIAFEDEEIEKERGVVIEEWRLGRSAAGRIRDQQLPVLFHGSRYAERLPIGEKEILETAPRSELVRFYRNWYRPDLIGVVAVGDFDATRIEELIREHFAGLDPVDDAPERIEFPIPDHEPTLVSVAKDPEATSISVQVEFKRPRVLRETVGDLRRSLIDAVYHGMMNDRLRELSRAADPPFQFAFAGSGALGRTRSTYRLFARVGDGGVERGLRTLLTEARRVEQHGFSPTELARAKLEILRSIDRLYEERDKLESSQLASQFVGHFLEDEPAPGVEWIHWLYRAMVPGIALAEVDARAEQWMGEVNRVILVSGPEKEEAAIPDEPELLAVFEEVERLEVTPWIDRVRDEPLVAAAPEPGTVTGTTTIEEIGVTRWTLSNGAIVLLKPTDFRNDEVLIRGWSPGGHSLASDETIFSAARAAEIVGQMGLGNFDRSELERALAGTVAGASAWIDDLAEGIRGGASPRDLETMFQLLWLRFTSPRRDEEAFASTIANLRSRLENQQASPAFWFALEMNRVLTQDHPRRRFLTLETLDQIRLDDALAVYRDRFADASDFIFTIVGNFEPESIRPLVERWIGGLPSTGRVESWRDVGIERPDGVRKVEVHRGIEPRSSVRILFHGDAAWSLDAEHRIASLADLLRICLREELREDRGGVYGVGVGGGISRHPEPEYVFNVSFSSDPERVDELLAAAFEEIERLKTEAPAADYLERVREIQRRERETALRRNPFWSSRLEYLASNDRDLGEILRDADRIASLTPESIRDAAREYLDTSSYVLGILHPESP
ncbi:MAG TPA: insulinase family protein [Thermoanaerobaculia bacterium]|nr:insulinase family protein [Thermoanaerobaculia bacterium]